MNLPTEASQLHSLKADCPDWIDINLLKSALPEQEWQALFFLFGPRAIVRVKPNPMCQEIRYVEGFYT